MARAGSPIKAEVRADEARWSPPGEGEKKLEAFSRGGMIIHALGKLLDQAGMKDLGFLANQSCTHEITVRQDWGKESFRFTVMSHHLDKIAGEIRAFLAWCRDHPEATAEAFWEKYGCDHAGREFESVAELLDKVRPSLKPNDEVCDSDSWDAALAFSVLKTVIALLEQAHARKHWAICEHWGGVECA